MVRRKRAAMSRATSSQHDNMACNNVGHKGGKSKSAARTNRKKDRWCALPCNNACQTWVENTFVFILPVSGVLCSPLVRNDIHHFGGDDITTVANSRNTNVPCFLGQDSYEEIRPAMQLPTISILETKFLPVHVRCPRRMCLGHLRSGHHSGSFPSRLAVTCPCSSMSTIMM